MKIRRLADTDLEVSEICLGTMTWGEQNTEAEAHAQLDLAIERGINFIDTAEMYPAPPRGETQGRTETYFGSWLARRRTRDDLVIASKVAGPGRRDWIRGGRTDLTAANIVEACDTSLARLGLERLDLYQIHWPQRNVQMFGQDRFDRTLEKGSAGPSIREQVEGMARLLEARKIRHWGLSNETSWGVVEFCRAAKELGVPGPATLQNSYSLVSRNPDGDLAEVLFRERVALLAYSPLGGGVLTGKYRNGARPDGARFVRFENFSPRFRKPLVADAVEAYAGIATQRGLTPVQLAIGWLRTRDVVGSIIVGATSTTQLEESIAAAQVDLDRETLAEIAAVQARFPNPAP
jgi:aryl-alcohol dehydrogenase (NADP+)